jgi:hypothetical protein
MAQVVDEIDKYATSARQKWFFTIYFLHTVYNKRVKGALAASHQPLVAGGWLLAP